MQADPFNVYEPQSLGTGSISVLAAERRRVRPKPPLGFGAPTNGGKPSKQTPADRRLKENKSLPPRPSKPPRTVPK